MATNKRVISAVNVKEKKASPSPTAKTPIRGTLNQSTKTSVSSPPQKQSPTSLIKPPTRSTATSASKPIAKKPASPETPKKPTVSRTTKVVSPVQKTRVPTNASTRSSSLSGKPVDSQKAIPSKNLKSPSKQGTSPSTVKKSSPKIKKEIESPSATKEHITSIQNVEIPSVVEAEEEVQDQESYIGGEKIDEQKGTDDHLVVEDQEPLDSAKKSEAETDDDADVKVVLSELSTDSVHEDIVPDVKIQDSDEKSSYVQVLEEDDNNNNNNNNSHVEAIEEDAGEAEKVEKEKEEEKEIDSGKESPEVKEPERKEVVVEEKKQEPAENKVPKQAERPHGKKDCALSNDVIEETISKLQARKNRVRALAGAFETVISLQDK